MHQEWEHSNPSHMPEAKIMAIIREGGTESKFKVVNLENSTGYTNANGIYTFQNVILRDFKFTKKVFLALIKKQILQLLIILHKEGNPCQITNAYFSKELMLHSRKVKDVSSKVHQT